MPQRRVFIASKTPFLLRIGQNKNQSNFWREGSLLDGFAEGVFGEYEELSRLNGAIKHIRLGK